MARPWIVCFCCSLLTSALGLETLSLSGSVWTLTGETKTTKYRLSATVPGSVYTDLQRAGYLGDPYYGTNDVQYRWVAYTNWTYTRAFYVPASMLSHRHIQLVLHGVDTVANVSINDQQVATVDNMFRTYRVDMDLLSTQNTITVRFTSPVEWAAKKAKQYKYDVPEDCPSPVQHGECHRNFIRKEGCSFSWDWGPAFPTMGIWKDISIEAYNTAILKDFTALTSYNDVDKVWNVYGILYFETILGQAVHGHMMFELPELQRKLPLYDIAVNEDGEAHYAIALDPTLSQTVDPWWPNGYGEQNLYKLNVVYTSEDGTESDTKSRKIGFRSVRLVQDPIPGATGLTFYFEVNNVPIYMKGSNWIPADSFQERITEDYLRKLLSSAAIANMNMLRVWGGGVYESDTFYSLCDELGIMIWQDFMFACTLYPADAAFLDNVRREIKDQVRRLGSHASIALWAGNNENDQTLNAVSDPQGQYHRDYVALYIDTIRKVVMETDPSRPFVSSSPANGAHTETEGWTPKQPNDPHYGDTHQYDYVSDMWDWHKTSVPRFGSEYGLQSWCSIENLAKVADPKDLTINSDFASHRQHHANGNQQMADEASLHFKLPNVTDPTEQFKRFIYITQINQAMGIKTISEVYRRSQSAVDKDGYGRTMGSLYWQLNDIWQAPTWASIEYGGKWKMLHYFARHFYSAELVSPYIDGGLLKVAYIADQVQSAATKTHKHKIRHKRKKLSAPNQSRKINDATMSMTADTLTMTCYTWSSLQPLKTWTLPFTKPTQAAAVIYQENITTIMQQAQCPSPQHCLLVFSLEGSINFLFLDNDLKRAVGMRPANIRLYDNVERVGEDLYALTLETSAVAPFVWLEAEGIEGYFSDNGFLMTDPKVKLQFQAWTKTDAATLARSLVVTSLMDVYR